MSSYISASPAMVTPPRWATWHEGRTPAPCPCIAHYLANTRTPSIRQSPPPQRSQPGARPQSRPPSPHPPGMPTNTQVSYSRFIPGLQAENIQLNRKVLSELAMNEPFSFKALVDQVKFMRGLPPQGGPEDGQQHAGRRQQGP
jgi:hypothetical protein